MIDRSNKTDKVSVCVVTYNQEKYIRHCLQSIIDQETDFSFEVIVGDDCSTDKTREIVQEFAEKYPDIIKPLFHEKNGGGNNNYLSVHGAATGTYIAHVDGDDYLLPGKLQMQAECLDNNPICNIVWHAMEIIDVRTDSIRYDYMPKGLYPNGGFTRGDLLAIGSVGCHSSKMYRNSCKDRLETDIRFIDFYTDIKHIGDGRGMFINSVLGGYRANVGVSSRGFMTRQRLLENMDRLFYQYPHERNKLGSLVLRLFLGDLLKQKPTISLSWPLFKKTFSFGVIYDFVRISYLLKFAKRAP